MKRSECPRSGHGRGLLFILLSTLLALASAACSNPEKAKAEHLQRGEQYLKAKKFPEAELEFRNALQLDEKSMAAHWGLAQAYEGQENAGPALREMQRAVELDPTYQDARTMDAAVHLANFYLVIYQGAPEKNKQAKDEAWKIANDVLGRNPKHIEGHILKAGLLYADGKRDEALAELKTAVDIDPQRIESLMSLARYYTQSGDPANAEATYRRALAVNNNSALAHIQYAYFHAQRNDLAGAEAEFRKAVEVEPGSRDARLALARFYYGNKQFDKAEAAFKEVADIDKERPEGRIVLGDFYASVGRYDDATRIYQEIITRTPDYTSARYRLGELMLQRGDLQGAANQAKEVLAKNPGDINARRLSARVNLQRGEAKKAIDDLAQVLKQEPRDQLALYFMTQAQLGIGQIEQARSYAGDLDKYHPDYLPGKLLQAQINLRAGGEENMKSAQRIASDLLDRLGHTAPSAQLSPELMTELRAKAYTARGAALLQLKNVAAARADFVAARDTLPNSPEGYINLGGLSFGENKLAEAEQSYERALQIDNANLAALSGLINIYTKQQQLDRAHARIDQALAAQPNNAGLHFLKAQIYGLQQNAQATEGELRRTLELDPNNAAALTALAAVYVNTNNPQAAIDEYRKVADPAHTPDTDDAAALTLIGMIEDGRGKRDEAVAAYKDALTRNPPPDIAAIAGNNLAWDYAEYGKGNLDEAVRLAQGVVQKYPDEPGYSDTLGWVYFKKGLAGAAVEQLQKALNQTTARGNESALYHLHLGRALAAMGGRNLEARQHLQRAIELGEKKALSPEQLADARQALSTLS